MWNSRFLTRITLATLMILTTCAVSSGDVAPKPSPQTPPSPAVKTAQEFVLNGDCVKTVTFAPEFLIHVPMDDKGEPMASKMYTTGRMSFGLDRDAEGCEYKVMSKEIREQ